MKKAVPDKSSHTFGWYERDIEERPRNSDQVVYSLTDQSIKLSIRILELFPGENSPARMLGYHVTISHTDIKPVYMIEQFRSRKK